MTIEGLSARRRDPTGPTIFTEMQEQFGAEAHAGQRAIEFLIIDHVERPSEN
jgi:uncharacterized protein (TIGR03435 family)